MSHGKSQIRKVTKEFSPSESPHYFSASAHNLTWIKGTLLEIIEKGPYMCRVQALPHGRCLSVETLMLELYTEPLKDENECTNSKIHV